MPDSHAMRTVKDDLAYSRTTGALKTALIFLKNAERVLPLTAPAVQRDALRDAKDSLETALETLEEAWWEK